MTDTTAMSANGYPLLDAQSITSDIDRIKHLISLSPSGREGFSHQVFRRVLGGNVSQEQIIGELDAFKDKLTHLTPTPSPVPIDDHSSVNGTARDHLTDRLTKLENELDLVKTQREEWLEDAEQRLDKALESRDAALKQVDTLQMAVKDTESQRRSVLDELDQLRQSAGTASKDLASLRQAYGKLQSEHDATKTGFATANQRTASMTEELESTKATLSVQQDTIKRLKAESDEKQNEVKRNLADVAMRLAKATNEARSERENGEAARKELVVAKAGADAGKQRCYELNDALANAQTSHKQELDSLTMTHEKEIGGLSVKHKSHIDENLSTHKNKLQTLMDNHNKELQKKDMALVQCQKKFEASESKAANVQHELEQISANSSQEAEKFAKNTLEHQQKLKDLKSELEQYRSKITGLQREVDTTNSQLRQQTDEASRLVDDIKTKHKKELAGSALSIQDRDDKLQALATELEQVQSSQVQSRKQLDADHQKELGDLINKHEEDAKSNADAHERQLTSLKDKHSNDLKKRIELSVSLQKELTELKETHEKQIVDLEDAQRKGLADSRQSNQKDVETREAKIREVNEQLQALAAEHGATTKAMKANHEKELVACRQKLGQSQTEIAEANSLLKTLSSEHEAAIQALRSTHEKDLVACRQSLLENHQAEMVEANSKLRTLASEHGTTTKAMKLDHENELAACRQSLRDNHQTEIAETKSQLRTLSEEHEAAMQAIRLTHEKDLLACRQGLLGSHQTEIAEADSKLRTLTSEHEATIKAIRSNHEKDLAASREHTSDKQKAFLQAEQDKAAALNRQLEEAQTKHSKELSSLKSGHEQAILDQHRASDKIRAEVKFQQDRNKELQYQLGNIVAEREKEVAKLASKHKQELAHEREILEETHNKALQTQQSKSADLEIQINDLKNSHQAELQKALTDKKQVLDDRDGRLAKLERQLKAADDKLSDATKQWQAQHDIARADADKTLKDTVRDLEKRHNQYVEQKETEHSNTIRSLSGSHDIAMQQSVKHHDAAMQKQHESASAAQESLRNDVDSLERRLKSLQSEHDDSARITQAEHDNVLKSLEDRKAALIESNATERKSIEQQVADEHAAKLSAEQNKHDIAIKELKDRHSEALRQEQARSANAQKAAGEKEMVESRLKEEHLGKIREIQEKYEVAIAKLDQEHVQQRVDSEKQVALAREEQSTRLQTVQADHQRVVDELQDSITKLQEQSAKTVAKIEARLNSAQNAHMQELTAVNQAKDSAIAEAIRSHTERFDEQRSRSELKIDTLQSQHNLALDELRSRLSQEKATIEQQLSETLSEHQKLANDSQDLQKRITDLQEKCKDLETNAEDRRRTDLVAQLPSNHGLTASFPADGSIAMDNKENLGGFAKGSQSTIQHLRQLPGDTRAESEKGRPSTDVSTHRRITSSQNLRLQHSTSRSSQCKPQVEKNNLSDTPQLNAIDDLSNLMSQLKTVDANDSDSVKTKPDSGYIVKTTDLFQSHEVIDSRIASRSRDLESLSSDLSIQPDDFEESFQQDDDAQSVSGRIRDSAVPLRQSSDAAERQYSTVQPGPVRPISASSYSSLVPDTASTPAAARTVLPDIRSEDDPRRFSMSLRTGLNDKNTDKDSQPVTSDSASPATLPKRSIDSVRTSQVWSSLDTAAAASVSAAKPRPGLDQDLSIAAHAFEGALARPRSTIRLVPTPAEADHPVTPLVALPPVAPVAPGKSKRTQRASENAAGPDPGLGSSSSTKHSSLVNLFRSGSVSGSGSGSASRLVKGHARHASEQSGRKR